jgi:hypothetical protein
MVLSKINPKVNYKNTKKTETDDYKKEATTYDIEFNKQNMKRTISVAFGKEKNEYIHEGIIYFPMYLVIENDTKGQIGIFEISMDEYPSIKDEDGDIDPDKIKPLLYDFVTEEYLNSFYEKKEDDLDLGAIDLDNSNKVEQVQNDKIIDKNKVLDEDEDGDIFKVRNANSGKEIEVPDKIEPFSIFTIDKNLNQPPVLIEEHKSYREEKLESSRGEWIEKFMRNRNYKIQNNEGDGDSYFAVIRDAFNQIGHNTTIQKIRDILAEEATDDLFQEYRTVYLSIENEMIENNNKIANFNKNLKILKNRINEIMSNKEPNKEEHNKVIIEARNIENIIKILKKDNRENEAFLKNNFDFMKNIDTFDKFKNYIKTSSYSVDAWAISTLENLLNIKVIILSEEAFNANSLDNVLKCGEINKNIQSIGTFSPNYYIMASYNKEHYRLISYKDKKILTYREIPYDVKMLIINKCMERNSGVYYLIKDFRNLKEKMGIPIDMGSPISLNQDVYQSFSKMKLYDPSIEFQFYLYSENKPPGKGSGEIIPNDKLIQFKQLAKINNWRKKLDDDWEEAPFTIDNHRWGSVEHYYQGSKFKKGFPDFYLKFSLDSESDISKDVSLAKKAGSKTPGDLRSKQIIIDPDFYGERNLIEYELALHSKFEQNLDLKEMLKSTYPAKLIHFKRGSEPEVCNYLMKIRNDF